MWDWTCSLWKRMEWADQHGIWDLLSLFVLVVTASIGIKLLLLPKRRVTHLNVFAKTTPRTEGRYPLRVHVEIRNFTQKAVVISVHPFKMQGLRPDPDGRGHSESGEVEVKFPAKPGDGLSEIDYFLRHGESVATWIPIDPSHSDEEVACALRNCTVGLLTLTCTWFGAPRPMSHRLVTKI